MPIHPETLPIPIQLLIVYLLIGLYTQLPGVAFGHFLKLRKFRSYATSGRTMKILLGIRWLAFTVAFWFIPFFRAGVNWITLSLIGLGVATAIVVLRLAETLQFAVGATVVGALLSLWLARRYVLRG